MRVPVIVVGCMLDKRDDDYPVSLEQVMSPIMQQFREIETCIECSALKFIQVKLIGICMLLASHTGLYCCCILTLGILYDFGGLRYTYNLSS